MPKVWQKFGKYESYRKVLGKYKEINRRLMEKYQESTEIVMIMCKEKA